MVNKFGISRNRYSSSAEKEVRIKTGGVSQKYVDNNFFKLDGTSQLRGSVNMSQQKVINMGTPVVDEDAATKAYVDQHRGTAAQYISSSGYSKGDINLGSHRLSNMASPIHDNDAATKNYSDQQKISMINTMNVRENNLSYEIGRRLLIDGGTMNGILNMGDFAIKNVYQDTDQKSVATIKFVTDADKKLETVLKKLIQDQLSTDALKKLIDGITPVLHIPDYIKDNAEQFIECKSEYITFSDSLKHVMELKDITGNGNHIFQKDQVNGIQPMLCKDEERVNGRYYISFDGSSQFTSKLNLGAEAGILDMISIFVVYRIRGFNANKNDLTNGLFAGGIRDSILNNRSDARMACFSQPNHNYDGVANLLINGVGDNRNTIVSIGPTEQNHGVTRSDPYLTKAEPGRKDIINCLSIHWNRPGVSFDSQIFL